MDQTLTVIFSLLLIYLCVKRYLKTRNKIIFVYTSWGIIGILFILFNINILIILIFYLCSFIIGKLLSKHWVWYIPILFQTLFVISYIFRDTYNIMDISNMKTIIIILFGIILFITSSLSD
jgi:hypothetical protein